MCERIMDINISNFNTFNVHRNVMSASSANFKAMFNRNFIEGQANTILLRGISNSALETLIRFCYAQKIEIGNVADVLMTADMFSILDLVEMCTDFCVKELRVGNARGMLELGARCHLVKFHEMTQKFVHRHFCQTVLDPSFMDLTFKQLAELLRHLYHWRHASPGKS